MYSFFLKYDYQKPYRYSHKRMTINFGSPYIAIIEFTVLFPANLTLRKTINQEHLG